jgi:hypothetical protein
VTGPTRDHLLDALAVVRAYRDDDAVAYPAIMDRGDDSVEHLMEMMSSLAYLVYRLAQTIADVHSPGSADELLDTLTRGIAARDPDLDEGGAT